MGSRRSLWRKLSSALLIPLTAWLAGCSELKQTPFDPKGYVARVQFELLNLQMWLAILVGVFVVVASFYVIVKFREKPGQTGEPPQVKGNHKLEVLWTLIPVVLLAIVAVPTVKAAFALAHPPQGSQALNIKVTGKQWFWNFDYLDEKFTVSNELVIPVGRPINLEVTSEDVIHSFWIPKLAGTIDVIPNRTNHLWFQADEPGTYYGQCKEFCGASHAKMRFRVIALPQAEYDAWVKNRIAKAQNYQQPADPVLARGEEIFMKSKPCFSCHAVAGSNAKGKVGPDLTNIGERKTLAAGWMDNTEENLKQWIKDSKSIKPGSIMPSFPDLSDEDLKALVAYLRSLK